eukprot:UN08260
MTSKLKEQMKKVEQELSDVQDELIQSKTQVESQNNTIQQLQQEIADWEFKADQQMVRIKAFEAQVQHFEQQVTSLIEERAQQQTQNQQ